MPPHINGEGMPMKYKVAATTPPQVSYGLTELGRAEVSQWWGSPVERSEAPRDELAIKLALAVTSPGVDVHRVVQTQCTATMRHLRDLTRLKQQAIAGEGAERDLAWLLVLESLVFGSEAEVRWLDHVESALARHAARSAAGGRRVITAVEPAYDLSVAHREPQGGSR